MNHPLASLQPVTAVPRGQRGVALVMALILLLVLTMISVAAVQSTSLEEKMSANERDHDLALEAAEAGLRVGEAGVLQDLWPDYSINTAGNYLYDPVNAPATPLWTTLAQSNAWVDGNAAVLDYKSQANVYFSSLPGAQRVAQDPLFVVQQMPPVANPGQNIGAAQYGADTPTIQVYRVTALGTGGDTNSQVMLQSTIHQ